MELPEPLERLFGEEIDAYQKEKRMPFVTITERMAMEKGLLEGIGAVLEVKFGEEGLKLLPEIREIQDDEALLKILRSLKTARSTDDVRRICARAHRPRKTRRK